MHSVVEMWKRFYADNLALLVLAIMLWAVALITNIIYKHCHCVWFCVSTWGIEEMEFSWISWMCCWEVLILLRLGFTMDGHLWHNRKKFSWAQVQNRSILTSQHRLNEDIRDLPPPVLRKLLESFWMECPLSVICLLIFK